MPETLEQQAPPQETTQPRAEQHEGYAGRERLTHEELRRVFAEAAILLILSATYKVSETAANLNNSMRMPDLADMDDVSNEAILFGLLVNALSQKGAEPTRPTDWPTYTMSGSRPSFYSFDNSYIYRDFYGKSAKAQPSAPSTPHAAGGPSEHRAPHASRTPRSSYSFRQAPPPAPTNTNTAANNAEQSAELPPLPFNDRIRPGSAIKRPTEADFAAAKRANEMYQQALWDSGWRGGEITPQQAKSASRGMVRQGHSFDATPADAEAFKMFNSHNASRGKQGTGPVNTERSDRSDEPEAKSAETPAPAPAPGPTAAPSSDTAGSSAE